MIHMVVVQSVRLFRAPRTKQTKPMSFNLDSVSDPETRPKHFSLNHVRPALLVGGPHQWRGGKRKKCRACRIGTRQSQNSVFAHDQRWVVFPCSHYTVLKYVALHEAQQVESLLAP